MHLTLNISRNGLATALDPLLDLAESSIKTYRKRILARHLETVIFCRVV